MKTKRNESGFSMIEMLVAAAIMVVLVMMLSMLFQGTSTAWRIGVRRAEGYTRLRSAIGAMQRDASAAVPEQSIPPEIRSKLGGSQSFSGGLSFYTLTGTGADPALRSPTFVQYSATGDRKVTTLTGSGGTENTENNVMDFVSGSSQAGQLFTQITGIEAGPTPALGGLPLFVKISARVSTRGTSLDIGAASAGPDKAWGTKDDIRTWVK
jgi:prepilin-type N-terminal cleavage/methylation domain-containing protein